MTSTFGKKSWILLSSISAVAVWGIVAVLVNREIILPTPWDTALYVVALLGKRAALGAIIATLVRVSISFLINMLASILLGIAAGFVPRIAWTLEPVITIMKSIPTMGVILLSLIWFNSETAVLFVCTLIVFPVLYSAVTEGIRSLDRNLIEMHRVFRIPAGKALRFFILPSLRPFLIAGLTSGLGLSMKVIVAAEVLSQPGTGIGTMFQIERASLNTVGVFAWSVIVILLTAGIDSVLVLLRSKSPVTRNKAGR